MRTPSPEQIRKAIELRGDEHRGQLEDCRELIQEFRVTKNADLARHLGVSERTVQRYKAEMRWGVS